LKTQRTPWLTFHDAPLKDNTAKTFNLATSALSDSAIGGQWANAFKASGWDAKNLENIFRNNGGVPNNIEIAAWIEKGSATETFKFRVDSFAGLGSDVDRLLLVSAVCGSAKLFTRPIRPNTYSGEAVGNINSSFYADEFTETKNYGHTFIKLDAAGDGGKAKIHGDGLGILYLAINLVSTLPNSGAVGFAIRGW